MAPTTHLVIIGSISIIIITFIVIGNSNRELLQQAAFAVAPNFSTIIVLRKQHHYN